MDIIKESPLEFTDWEEKGKAGNIYWDPSNDLYVYWELVVAGTWQYIPVTLALEIGGLKERNKNMGQDLQDARLQIADQNITAARLQEDLAGVKDRLVTAQKRRDKAEKSVEKVKQAHQDTLDLLANTKKELRTTTEALGRAQNDVKGKDKELEGSRGDLAQALGSIGTLERGAATQADELEISKQTAGALGRRVDELEDSLAEKAPALNPEDVVDLRATCTVDEVLRMRAAGVL